MSHNPHLLPQIIKTVIENTDWIDVSLGVSEKITNSERFLELSKNIKNKFNDKLGIKKREEEFTRSTTHVHNKRKSLNAEEKVYYRSQYEENKRASIESDNEGLIPAIIINVVIWGGLLHGIIQLLNS